MCSETTSLSELKICKETLLRSNSTNNAELNRNHDEIMKKVFHYIIKKVVDEYGNPPCDFVWFVTGSAGRKEQGILSDQDHGIIYERQDNTCLQYFLQLGQRLSDALNQVGYPYCEGKVMSNNPIWCKSVEEWKLQILNWMEKDNWESIRYLQIFYDSRKIYGAPNYVLELRSIIHEYREINPNLIKRFMENVMRIKKGVGIFGQFFVERNGVHRGSVHLKHTMYLPYVNSIRLLAIKEGIQETSTIERIHALREDSKYKTFLQPYEQYFNRILEYRVNLFREARRYEDVHYLNISSLTKEERQEVKNLMRNGIKLYQQVKRQIEKGC